MAGLAKTILCSNGFCRVPSCVLVRSVSSTPKVSGPLNRDWKPGKFPETPEERAAAAKKYGLRPEDYKPYDPDKDTGYGDYPDLKWVGKDGRDPYEHYDYSHMGYNYGDTMHRFANLSTGDRYDPEWEAKNKYSEWQLFAGFFSVCGGILVLGLLCSKYGIVTHMPALPKQYPNNLWIERGRDPAKIPSVTHYTFEPAE